MNDIPKGTWRGRGVSAALGYTSQDGEQVGVEIQFSPDQHDDVDGQHMTWYGQFSEKAEPFTLKTLRALGWSGDDLSDFSGIDANEVDVVVDYEQDLQGEWRARIRFINPLGQGGVAMKNKMTPEQAKAFAERMRGRVLAMNKTAPAPAAAATSAPKTNPKPAAKPAAKPNKRAPAAAEAQAPDDDNIPF